MNKIKLIVLLSQPVNAHIERKLNLNQLIEKGFDLEVLDLSAFMMPHYPNVDFRLNESPNLTITKLKSRKNLKSFLEQYSERCVALDAANQDPWIRHQLNCNQIPVIRYIAGGLPVSHPDVDGNISSTVSLIKRALGRVKRAEITGLIKNVFELCYKKYYFLFYRPYLNVLIIGGERLLWNESQYINKDTLLIESHISDLEEYEKLLGYKVERLPEKYLVFIDQNILNHPDFALQNTKYTDPIAYITRIQNFFEKVERLGYEVVIALHPRADESGLQHQFGNRKCFKHKTASLVANSTGIITHFSNAINYAVLNYKPILFIADTELIQMNFQIKILSSWLQKSVLMLDEEISLPSLQSELKSEGVYYQRYKQNFIQCKSDAGMPVVDILSEQVLRLSKLN